MCLRCPLALLLCVLTCSFSHAAVLSIGHRGNSLYAPENTIASFLACTGKADLVELDGQVTSDGYLVVMHDATVARTTDGTGSVSALTLAQIKALDAGSWFSTNFIGERVPTLEESITNILPFATPLIERKAGSAAAYANELRRLNVISNVVVQAFDWNFLKSLHALEPGLPLGALGDGTFSAQTLTNIIDSGASMVAWERGDVDPAMVSLVHSAGLQLFVWTVDGPAIQDYIELGVDGIISNDPGLVRQLEQPPTGSYSLDLRRDLVAYWKMDDGLNDPMATAVTDSKSTNHTSLVRGDAQSHWFGAGAAMFGGCLHLNGLNSWVPMPRTEALDIGTNALSLSLWLKLEALPSQLASSYGAILDSTNDCYVLYLDKSNRELRFKITDVTGDAARPGIPESRLVTNQWLHVVATYSGATGQAAIYLNGEARDLHTGSDSRTPLGLNGNVKPGQNAAMGREGFVGSSPFSGMVDDFALWQRALNPAEIAEIYTGALAGQSLRDLLAAPTALIQYRASRIITGNRLEIDFVCQGPWQTFRLQRAPEAAGRYLTLPSLSPVSLGARQYRFTVPLTGSGLGFYRVEAE